MSGPRQRPGLPQRPFLQRPAPRLRDLPAAPAVALALAALAAGCASVD